MYINMAEASTSTRSAVARLQEREYVPPLGELSSDEEDFVESESEGFSVEECVDFGDDTPEFSDSEMEDQPTTSRRTKSTRATTSSKKGRPRSVVCGRNNFKWYLHGPERRGRPSKGENHVPTNIGEARNAKTPLDAWTLLLPDTQIQKILQHTNEEIQRRLPTITPQTYHRETNITELKAFIGILYFAGIQKKRQN
ncbi:hypothetical protein ABEB36_003632 [Hypothenemus hampei]|uniref:PiggyBac transposable element-derived protein domain-containing protein n=1 Tax=Hypothenemus hampei TaxID=57062 RepID=A0ABD1FDF8_HYPHA